MNDMFRDKDKIVESAVNGDSISYNIHFMKEWEMYYFTYKGGQYASTQIMLGFTSLRNNAVL